MSKFSVKLRQIMDDRGMTQAELSKMTGLYQSLISGYLNDKYEPKSDKIGLIAKSLNVSPSFLLGDDDQESYYLDKETQEIADNIHKNKELKLLFDAAKDASPEDLETTHQMLLALKRKEKRTDG